MSGLFFHCAVRKNRHITTDVLFQTGMFVECQVWFCSAGFLHSICVHGWTCEGMWARSAHQSEKGGQHVQLLYSFIHWTVSWLHLQSRSMHCNRKQKCVASHRTLQVKKQLLVWLKWFKQRLQRHTRARTDNVNFDYLHQLKDTPDQHQPTTSQCLSYKDDRGLELYEIMCLLSKSEKGEKGKCLSIAINVKS